MPLDPRRYQWAVGAVGLVVLIAFSAYLFANGHAGAPGVPPGSRLREFVAPLATSDLEAPANVRPRCDPRDPARRGLNVCDRRPIVLAFFVLGARPCERAVSALQAVSRSFRGIQFAALAVSAGRALTARLVRDRGWTIPVAYDLTGVVGQLYGVSVCPLLELALAGGVVQQRLIGEGWERPVRLAAAVRRLAAAAGD